MPESEFVSLIKPWIAKPYDQLSPEIQTIVWQRFPQRQDPRYLLPPRRFVSLWDDLDEKDRLKAARNVDAAFELGFREPPGGPRVGAAKWIDIKAWETSRYCIVGRFGVAEKNARPMEPTNDGGEGPVPEIPAWLSPMEFAAYAATDNPWLVARCAPDGSGCELDQLELQAFNSRSLSPIKVLEKAVDMLRAGEIALTALRDDARRKMPAEDWRYWTISTSPVVENALAVCDVERREPVEGWTNFLISREHADLVRVALLGLRETPAAHAPAPAKKVLRQGSAKRRPQSSPVMDKAVETMVREVREGKTSLAALMGIKQEALPEMYGASRTTLVIARTTAKQRLIADGFSETDTPATNDK